MMEIQKPPEFLISNKIQEFLLKNTLPTESEISRHATYLAFRYGSDAKKIKKDIIDKVKISIKDVIDRKEIDRFFAEYPQPKQTDIDDFVKYLHLLRPQLQEDELRQQIEKERLYRKFGGRPRDIGETSELDKFIDIIKTRIVKEDCIKAMQKQGLSYVIKDESGISDKLLKEFIKLIHWIHCHIEFEIIANALKGIVVFCRYLFCDILISVVHVYDWIPFQKITIGIE